MISPFHRTATVVLLLVIGGCQSEDKSDAQFRAEIVSSMHQLLMTEVRGLNKAARDLQTNAPSPVGRGWDASDQAAIDKMKTAWVGTRASWERAEGTLAALFHTLDESMDSRYEDLLMALGGGDPTPFDGEGVIGMHAIERILYATETPAPVVTYEAALAGYQAAAWPATEQEAAAFKTGLCARLVNDTQQLMDQWGPLAINLGDVFTGLTGLMSAQQEKVSLAAEQKEESRYSMRTMGDLRFNLAGTRAIFDLFTPWLATKTYGTTLSGHAQMAFDRLQQTYDSVSGDAIPPPPATWNSTLPSIDDQQTPFGQLYGSVVLEVDVSRAGSAVDVMNQVARALGLPEFTGTSP
jgi:iron uptake system component EfeO